MMNTETNNNKKKHLPLILVNCSYFYCINLVDNTFCPILSAFYVAVHLYQKKCRVHDTVISFNTGGNWELERGSKLSAFMQLLQERGVIWTQILLTPKPVLFKHRFISCALCLLKHLSHIILLSYLSHYVIQLFCLRKLAEVQWD